MRYFLAIALVGCGQLGTTNTYRDGCEVSVSYDDCPSGCVILDEHDVIGNIWQCGGSGSAIDPDDNDDCVTAYGSLQLDEDGNQACGTCTDIEGDTGDGPWTYLMFEVWRCESDSGAPDQSLVQSLTDNERHRPISGSGARPRQ